ncbi:hypothetical protein EIN_438610 [Entamoeba invadens IP1]|uniref:TLDc domain-containing protein n=1 Tax=Entamoeba invadens IP1 TaxID=370355 RepID=A0A0A1U728_ENTIV|nr:hypothetical protein EIN_438610 [Entamoeba invadens IP1]ELP88801.1 hypothetical protein EIN_438610 [Entamoeba invadens IP1]|eukprot:XP_004255572.1 hypothetical protein EIN_438610 [Entamoeba invadens IP1]
MAEFQEQGKLLHENIKVLKKHLYALDQLSTNRDAQPKYNFPLNIDKMSVNEATNALYELLEKCTNGLNIFSKYAWELKKTKGAMVDLCHLIESLNLQCEDDNKKLIEFNNKVVEELINKEQQRLFTELSLNKFRKEQLTEELNETIYNLQLMKKEEKTLSKSFLTQSSIFTQTEKCDTKPLLKNFQNVQKIQTDKQNTTEDKASSPKSPPIEILNATNEQNKGLAFDHKISEIAVHELRKSETLATDEVNLFDDTSNLVSESETNNSNYEIHLINNLSPIQTTQEKISINTININNNNNNNTINNSNRVTLNDLSEDERNQLFKWSGRSVGIPFVEIPLETPMLKKQLLKLTTTRNGFFVVIQDKGGNLIGGFVSHRVAKDGAFVADANCFLFTLKVDGKVQFQKFEMARTRHKFAFYIGTNRSTRLIDFGCGDLCLMSVGRFGKRTNEKVTYTMTKQSFQYGDKINLLNTSNEENEILSATFFEAVDGSQSFY